jgi:PhnB protein
MVTRLNPYLSFAGNARDAMDFYHSVFGGEVTRSTFGEMPDVPGHEAVADQIMHSMLITGGGIALMCSDTPPGMGEPSPNSAISLSGEDEDELRGYWDALIAGGTINVPLEAAPWGDSFGMCVDKFGVPWMVNIAGSAQ